MLIRLVVNSHRLSRPSRNRVSRTTLLSSHKLPSEHTLACAIQYIEPCADITLPTVSVMFSSVYSSTWSSIVLSPKRDYKKNDSVLDVTHPMSAIVTYVVIV